MHANSTLTRGRTGDAGRRGQCRQVRERLCESPLAPLRTAPPPSPAAPPSLLPPALAEHLAACADCAAFARRLQLARQALGRPLAGIEPDPDFSARVLARIARPAELIGWAAFRALPAALGLALVLAWLGLSSPAAAPPAPPSPLLDGPPSSDQLLAWASLSPEVWP
jgi:hypothetical protein